MVLTRMTDCMDCLVKEASEIQLHPNNFKRYGICPKLLWYPDTNTLKLKKCHKEGPMASNMNSDD
jgi:hypothetical protein